MKYKKSVTVLVLIIAVLSLTACIAGLAVRGGSGEYEFKSINNEIVKIYGQGLYKNDSVSCVAQGKASDLVTLVLGIPLLMISLYFSNKGSFRGKLMLTGTLGYFLYTYMSYAFLWNYNPIFLIYVILMSASLYAFILSLMSFDIADVPSKFKAGLPVKFLSGFQFFIAFVIGMMWLGKIAPSLAGAVPAGLEHYTTLVIQAMDLGIVVPTGILSGVMLLKRKPVGYLLSSVVIIKGITMLTAISAMIVNQLLYGVKVSPAELIIFPAFNLFAIVCLVLLLKNIVKSNRVPAGG